MKYIALADQSFFDLAIMLCGDADAAYPLAQVHGKEVTDEVSAGDEIEYSTELLVNKRIRDQFLDNKKHITTAPRLSESTRTFDETFDLTFS